ncbi:M56 family metallopeptidase [Dokdonella sp.]|uniref:M56 family metallopeptidase n=1 Tax=Dokdonella sp. TaxID=2291710 RepID=UPI003C3B78FA
MTTDALALLAKLVLVSSIAILVVLSLRHFVRRAFGANLTYALWLLVPISLLVGVIPRPKAMTILTPVAASQPLLSTVVDGIVETPSGMDVGGWMMLVWASGVLLSLATTLILQRRFLRGLGALSMRDDGCWQARHDEIGPMLLGVVQPRIIVPAGFDQRYTANERDLIVAHERIHLQRGDAQFNALVVLIRSLQWFNPLVHLAVSCFRFDQELSCDARVIRIFPNARRSYADAMLKTQLIDFGLPIGCYWQSSHPIKERIAMFKKPLPSRSRKALGSSVLLASALATSCIVWAAQASEVPASYARLSPPAYPVDIAGVVVQGTVYLKVSVTSDGVPAEVVLDHVQPESMAAEVADSLAASAIDAVRTWTFNAARRDGKLAPGVVIVPVTFSATGEPSVTTAASGELTQLDSINVRKQ